MACGLNNNPRASDFGCTPEFDHYLDCLDRVGCNWRVDCAGERKTIETCVGSLPE